MLLHKVKLKNQGRKYLSRIATNEKHIIPNVPEQSILITETDSTKTL